jgi:hypothetical protein
MAIPQKPKMLYEVVIQRRKFIRRFVWSLLAAVTALAAAGALNVAENGAPVDATVVQVGVIISLVVAVLFGLRALASLWRALRQRTETLRIFDKGIMLTTPKGEQKMGWSQVTAFREGGSGIYLGSNPLLQWGGHRLKLQNGKVFRVTGKYGDLRKLGGYLRRYAAHVTGIQMGQLLRAEKPVKLNRSLTVWPGGVEVGKQEIPWSEVEVQLKNNRLTILRKNAKGKFKPVRRYNVKQVDNVGGFMEIATGTIRNHQRERFEKRSEMSTAVPQGRFAESVRAQNDNWNKGL